MYYVLEVIDKVKKGDKRPAFAASSAKATEVKESSGWQSRPQADGPHDRKTARQHDILLIFQLSEPFQVFCRFDKQPLN